MATWDYQQGGIRVGRLGANSLGWLLLSVEGEILRRGEGLCAVSDRDVERISCLVLAGRRPCEEIFVRYGLPPISGRSRNAATQRLEAGVSVLPATRDRKGRVRIDGRGIDPGWMMYRQMGLCLYEVTGIELDVMGGDGEPLLSHCEVVRELT